jgi:hypothetical protein
MIERATQFDPDHARRDAEPVRNVRLGSFLEPRGNQYLASALRQGFDCVMKGFQLQPCFSFTRWTGRRIRNFKRGPGFRSARPTAFRTTVVGRDVDGHLQDITSGAVHNPSIVVAMEAQPGLIQAFAGKLFGTETAR